MPIIPPNNTTGLYGIDTTVSINNTVTGNNLNITGNATIGGNIAAGNNISAVGNVSGNYILGNGAFLTGIAATYGNANVASYLASGTNANNISITGNIVGSYILGNGSQLTGLPATYGNANVSNYLANFGSNTISTTGNITGGYFIGDGSQLTGLPASYGNADVANYLANFGSNTISTTGNITGGTFVGSGAGLTSIPGGNVVGVVAQATQAAVANSANSVSGANVSGAVANATYAVSAGSATTAGTVTTNAQPNITSVGTLSSLSVTGNITGGNIATLGVFTGNGALPSGGAADTYLVKNSASSYDVSWTDRVNAKTIYENVKNISGTTLTKGTPVYQAGVVGNTITVGVARADDPAKLAVGVLDVALADQAEGRMLVLGEIKGVNTAGFTTGDEVYLGATGGYTNVPPSASNVAIQFLGVVNRVDSSQGSGFITGTLTPDPVKYSGGYTSTWTGTAWVPTTELSSDTSPALGGNLATGTYNISGTGNVTASYFAGDGSLLSNINASNIVGGYGNANVADFLANGFGSNTILTTGNISGGNINAQADVTSGNLSAQFTVSAGNITATGNVAGDGNIVGGNVIVPNARRYYGDFSAGPTAGRSFFQTTNTGTSATTFLSALPGPNHISTGTVAGAATGLFSHTDVSNSSLFGMYATPTESQIMSLRTGTGNINPITFRFGATGGSITTQASLSNVGVFSAAGNVQGANIITTGLVSAGGNISGGNITATGNISGGNLNVTGVFSTTGNITGGNLIATTLLTGPQIITTGGTGNITGANYVIANFFQGNGSLLTSLPAGTNITNGTSTIAIGASGGNANITIGGTSNVVVISTGGANVTGTLSASGNITGGNIGTAGRITATGNVIAGNIVGPSGSVATGIINYKDFVHTITYAATITPDAANGSIQQVTLTGNVTLNAFGGTPQAGQSMLIRFVQDGTGGRTLSSTMKWAGGVKTLSTAANAIDIASIFYDGTNYYASLTTGYA